MSFSAKILADSISPDNIRLTTFEVTLPRMVLAELNTHRALSRNSASSRAIPIQKTIKTIKNNPFVPSVWGKNQSGMQAETLVSPEEVKKAEEIWLAARDSMLEAAQKLLDVGIHKQITNRLLEPFMWHTVIVTATDYSNLFNLRDNPAAQPEIQIPAGMMRQLYETNQPKLLNYGEWHLPLIQPDEIEEIDRDKANSGFDWQYWVKISCARCARISYLTHNGERVHFEDLNLYDRLVGPGHMSPTEHSARPMTKEELSLFGGWDVWLSDGSLARTKSHENPCGREWNEKGVYISEARWTAFCGNLNGWIQHRKLILGEYDILGVRKKLANIV